LTIVQRDVITMPARHRAWDPVILKASVAHPAGPLPVLVACLEHATTYSDDRLAQAPCLLTLLLIRPPMGHVHRWRWVI
jgi:hypothetical protein